MDEASAATGAPGDSTLGNDSEMPRQAARKEEGCPGAGDEGSGRDMHKIEAKAEIRERQGGDGPAKADGAEAAGDGRVAVSGLTELMQEGSQLLERLPSEAAAEMSKLVASAGEPGAGSEVARALHTELAAHQQVCVCGCLCLRSRVCASNVCW